MRISKRDREEIIAQIERLVATHESKIAVAFIEVVQNIREVATLEALVARLESGESIAQILTDQVMTNAMSPLQIAIGTAVLGGARLTADLQPPVIGVNGAVVNFTFNATNPRLSQFASEVAAQRVREVSQDIRNTINEVVRRGSVAGQNPIEQARAVRASIGLTQRQERAVENFRRMLETGDAQALQRALRDRRFDPTVHRAIAGQQLNPAQIDRMVERYRERYIKYRSEVIARTEALRAVNGSAYEYMQTFIDEGLILEDQVRRFWHYTHDSRTRPAHRMIPSMNENGVGMREKFRTPEGPLQYPGDPNGRASNVIQCRCTAFNRVVSLELIQEQAA